MREEEKYSVWNHFRLTRRFGSRVASASDWRTRTAHGPLDGNVAMRPASATFTTGRAGAGQSQTLCNDGISRGVKHESEMRTRNREISSRPVSLAISPINHSVAFTVDRSFGYRSGHWMP